MLLFVPYALTLPVSGLSFMSIKICSVLLCSTIIVPFNKNTNLFAQLKCKSIARTELPFRTIILPFK